MGSSTTIQDAAARRTYLETACAGDEVLRRRVEALLSALENATGFLERPAFPEMHQITPIPVWSSLFFQYTRL